MDEAITPTELKQDLSETLQGRFRAGRLAAGYSLKQVGEAAGVSLQAISQFEAGKQHLQLPNFVAACDALHLNVRWVLKGLGRMHEGAPLVPKKRAARRG